MTGRIPPEFIDNLLTRIDIHDVINRRVPLRKAGHEFKACCPFHHEKTPSFTVNTRKQFYHCFGCGAHGSAIGFLMAYDNLEFPDAIADLAAMAGLEVPQVESWRGAASGGRPDDGQAAPRIDPHAVLLRASKYFKKQLRTHAQAGIAVDYLKSRGVNGEVSRDFGVGFAPPGWRSLVQEMGAGTGEVEALLQAGLVKKSDEGEVYDRFRNRIMFPIHDRRGRVIGFGGRALDDQGPKYLNSPETPVFHKGEHLYGLYQLLQAIRQPEFVIVVEGYLDVIALAQFGIRNVVATLGTAVTTRHLQSLFRVAPSVVFCFDGDEAGRRAAHKALQVVLPLMQESREASFLFLPEGEDPDSLVRSVGADGFMRVFRGRLSLSEFLFAQFEPQVDLGSLDGRARLIGLVRPMIFLVPDGAYRSLLLGRLADLSGLDVEQLAREVVSSASRRQPVKKAARQVDAITLSDRVARALLLEPEMARICDQENMEQLADYPDAEFLLFLFGYLKKQGSPTMGSMIEHCRDGKWQEKIATLLAAQSPLSEQEFEDALKRLANASQAYRRERILAKPEQALTDEDRKAFKELYRPK